MNTDLDVFSIGKVSDEESKRLINAYYVRELLVIARETWSDIYLPYLSNTIHIHMQRFVVNL